MLKVLRDLMLIGDEGDDSHRLPALAAGQRIGFVDVPNPFLPV